MPLLYGRSNRPHYCYGSCPSVAVCKLLYLRHYPLAFAVLHCTSADTFCRLLETYCFRQAMLPLATQPSASDSTTG